MRGFNKNNIDFTLSLKDRYYEKTLPVECSRFFRNFEGNTSNKSNKDIDTRKLYFIYVSYSRIARIVDVVVLEDTVIFVTRLVNEDGICVGDKQFYYQKRLDLDVEVDTSGEELREILIQECNGNYEEFIGKEVAMHVMEYYEKGHEMESIYSVEFIVMPYYSLWGVPPYHYSSLEG